MSTATPSKGYPTDEKKSSGIPDAPPPAYEGENIGSSSTAYKTEQQGYYNQAQTDQDRGNRTYIHKSQPTQPPVPVTKPAQPAQQTQSQAPYHQECSSGSQAQSNQQYYPQNQGNQGYYGQNQGGSCHGPPPQGCYGSPPRQGYFRSYGYQQNVYQNNGQYYQKPPQHQQQQQRPVYVQQQGTNPNSNDECANGCLSGLCLGALCGLLLF